MSPGDRILYVYIQYIYYMYMLFNWAQLGELDLHPFHRLCPLVAVLGFKDFPLMLSLCVFFPTCRALLLLTSTASARSQWALPDLNCKCQDRSGHCRTSTASARSQWALPDLNCKCQDRSGHYRTSTASVNCKCQDRSGHYRTSTASAKIAVGTAGPQQQAPDRSGHSQTSTARAQIAVGTTGPHQQASKGQMQVPRSQWALPDLNCKCQLQVPRSQWALVAA